MTPTPLRRIRTVHGLSQVYVKDESVWPNGTFKDRLSTLAVSRAGTEATTFVTLSYGNTAVSIARIARTQAVGGVEHSVVVVVPADFSHWRFGPSSLGTRICASDVLTQLRSLAIVVPAELGAKILDDEALHQLAVEAGAPSSRVLNITEGIDVPAYVGVIREAVEQLGRPPDVCIVPYGAGILCNEIRDYLAPLGRTTVVPLSVASSTSIARMLYGPIWVDTAALQRQGYAYSRHRSPDRTGAPRIPYRVWRVDESDVLSGLAIARSEDLSTEPSGAAGLGVLHRLSGLVPNLRPESDLVLVVNTGNGIDGLVRPRGSQ